MGTLSEVKALSVVVATLVLAGHAAAAPFLRAKPLEPAASYVAGKPVQVMCASSDAAWRGYVGGFGGPSDANGATFPGATVIRLSHLVCSAIVSHIDGDDIPDATLGPSVEVFTHESIHARGESDEGVTDCDAIHEMPGVAVRYFHVKAGKPLRALMAATWAWRHSAAAGSPYRSVC